MNRSQYAFVAQLLPCPPHLVLPGEEEIAGPPKLIFMVLPDVSADLDDSSRGS
jgi:hypothetical protein